MASGRPARLDAKQIERVIKLHKQGIPLREIARRFETSKTTVQKVLSKEEDLKKYNGGV